MTGLDRKNATSNGRTRHLPHDRDANLEIVIILANAVSAIILIYLLN